MRVLKAAAALTSSVLLVNPATASAVASSPDTFVRMLYADLARGARGEPAWKRHLSKHTAILERRLSAIDQRAGQSTIDLDWLCQCQDAGGLRLSKLTIAQASARATATVVVSVSGENEAVRLLLVNEGGWKIDDIISMSGLESGSRYTAALQHGIRSSSR